MAAIRHLQADCREPGSAPEPYARLSSMGYPFTCLSYRSNMNRLGLRGSENNTVDTTGILYCIIQRTEGS